MEHMVFDSDLTQTVQLRSCDQCHARKSKCSRRWPCLACTTSKTLCTYERRTKYRRKAAHITSRASAPAVAAAASPARASNPAVFSTAVAPTPAAETPATILPAAQITTSPAAAAGALQNNAPQRPGSPIAVPGLDAWCDSGMVDWEALLADDVVLQSPSSLQSHGTLVADLPVPSMPAPAPLVISCPLLQNDSGSSNGEARSVVTDDLVFLVTLFLQRLRPSMPFFDPSYLLNNLEEERHVHDRAFNALLHAIGALTLLQPMQGTDQDFIKDRVRRGTLLMEKAVQLHSSPDLGQSPVLENILTSVFLFACQFCSGNHSAARFRLQEALTLGEVMRLHRPREYGDIPVDERDRRLRTLLCLTVIEKVYCIQRDFPLHQFTLNAAGLSVALDLVKEGYGHYNQPEKNIMTGLNDMIDLVDFVDNRFVKCWKNQCWLEGSGYSHVPSSTVCSLLRRYGCPLSQSRYRGGGVSEAQFVDIVLTRHWIRNILWNLGLRHGFMNESNADIEMRKSYSLIIARETVEMCEHFSMSSLEIHGIGLVEKLYDIVSSAINSIELLRERSAVVAAPTGTSAEPASTHLDMEKVTKAKPAQPVFDSCFRAEEVPAASESALAASGAISHDFINRFLVIFASFRGGRHVFLRRYVQKMWQLSLFDE